MCGKSNILCQERAHLKQNGRETSLHLILPSDILLRSYAIRDTAFSGVAEHLHSFLGQIHSHLDQFSTGTT